MTIRSVGYEGSVGEGDWSAYLASRLGTPPSVAGVTDYEVTPAGGLAVRVAPGTASGWGITDVSDASEQVTLESPSSGTRYDAVVLRRDWAGSSTSPSGVSTGGKTSIAVVKGGSTQMVPALTQRPGVATADQPLALIELTAGSSTAKVVADLRVSYAPAAFVRSRLAMDLVPLGTQVTLGPRGAAGLEGRRYVMTQAANKTPQIVEEWEPAPPVIPPPPYVPKVAGGGPIRITTNEYGSDSFNHGLSWTPKSVIVAPILSTSSEMVTVYVSNTAGAVNSKAVNVTAKYAPRAGGAPKPFKGDLYIYWIAFGG